MLTAIPRHWFSWDFTLTDGKQPIAEIDTSWWRERGVLTIANASYRAYRERPFAGAFVLESSGSVLARAEKPSPFSRRLIIDRLGTRYVLKPPRILSRSFELLHNTTVVGALVPNGLLSRRMNINLSEELPVPVRAFVVWLAVIQWKRDAEF